MYELCYKDETKLRVSSESWMIHDMIKNCYKRGWTPNKVSAYDGMIRVIVLYIVCLVKKDIPTLNDFFVRINTGCLREHRKIMKVKKAN